MKDKKFTHTTFAGYDTYEIDGKEVDKFTYEAELNKQRNRQRKDKNV